MTPRSHAWLTALALALLALGCPRAGSQDPEPEPICSAGAVFSSHDWIPDDARLTTSIARRDADLDAALARLGERSDAAELPVLAAMNYRNLGLQLSILGRFLDELGADPSELVEVHGPDGEIAWIWANDCPLERIAARMLARWQLVLRADLERPGVRRASGSTEGLPFDLITFGDRRVALTLLGRGEDVAAWLHDSPHGDEAGPGRALDELEPAPIRSILSGDAIMGTALTSPGSNPEAPPTEPTARHRRLRVTEQDWFLDAARD